MERQKTILKKNGPVLLIHHWDCDGLCSAALLKIYLGRKYPDREIRTMTPHIGNYFLTGQEIDEISKYCPGCVFIIDMALPYQDIDEIKKMFRDVYIFDHHKQDIINEVNHINPAVRSVSPELECPSTGWVINKYFGKDQNVLSVLGAIGDQGEIIRRIPEAVQIIKKSVHGFEEFVEAVKHVDTYYIVNDRNGISRVIDLLVKYSDDFDNLLECLKKNDRGAVIDRELNRMLGEPVEKMHDAKVVFKEYKSNMHLISGITRRLSDTYPDFFIVTIDRGNGNIYIRRKEIDLDLSPIIKLAQNSGFNAGGKEEVVGIILPPECIDGFLVDILKYLKEGL